MLGQTSVSIVQARLMHYDDTDMLAVNLFMHWLYTQRIPATCRDLELIVQGTASSSNLMDKCLVLVKAYVLGDRILVPTFRRKINNLFVGLPNYVTKYPTDLLPIVTYAFANIPGDRTILQYLTNKFCDRWCPEWNSDNDHNALGKFPPTFTIRVMKRYAYLRYGNYGGCYVEHATVQEEESCVKAHMQYVGGAKDYGFFDEPQRPFVLDSDSD